jgi:ribose transport system substrate-binding protein
MKFPSRELATVTLCAAFAALSGCGGGAGHTSAEKYYLVCANSKIPYWQEAGSGLVQSATGIGVSAEMIGPETFDPKGEQEEFRRAVSKKPAGILVSPSDPEGLTADIDAAVAAGIPVVTIDSDAPKSKRLFFIGTNNYQAGVMGGRLAVKKLNGKGNVLIFTIAGQTNIEERLRGYKDAFEGHPGIKIVDVVDMHGDARVVFDKTMEIADKQKDKVDAFIALEALAGKEVAEVLDRKKVDGKLIFAMDTMAETLDWIEKGKIESTISQKPFTMAFFGVRVLADLRVGKMPSLTMNFAQDSRSPLPAFIDTGSALVDKENVAAYKQTAATK